MNPSFSSNTAAPSRKIDFPIAVKVIMIDLDGTLLNTADDLALSANLMLRDLEMPEQSTETIRSYIGKAYKSWSNAP